MGNTDSIPIVSQIKSLVQVANGDAEAAKTTQENFMRQAPVVSQVNSLVAYGRKCDKPYKFPKPRYLNIYSAVYEYLRS